MAKKLQVYKCGKCGNAVEVLSPGAGTLVCCGEAMALLEEKTADAGKEKHVPVLESKGSGSLVKVGSVPHPMDSDHYIEWVEALNGPWLNRKELKPGEKPEAEFYVPAGPGLAVRAYCNKHGLWKG